MTPYAYRTSTLVSDAPPGMFARVLRYDVRGVVVHAPEPPTDEPYRRREKPPAPRITVELTDAGVPHGRGLLPLKSGDLRVVGAFRYACRPYAPMVDVECGRCHVARVRTAASWRDVARMGAQCCERCRLTSQKRAGK